MNIDLNNVQRIHCIGIGGIGVSAIARMMHRAGKRVSGSDVARSPVTDMMRRIGVRVFIGHRAGNVGAADLVVYTKAVNADNPELRAAERHGIPCLSYAEMLGIVSRERYTIAVAGAHGKTTTTAMIGHILRTARRRPSVIVGGIMKNGGTNLLVGKGKYLVVEACEYKRSFLDIHPTIAVVTNIDNDHLDYYRNLANIRSAFGDFVEKLPREGFLVCALSDPNVRKIVGRTSARVVDYSKTPFRVRLQMNGAHNVKNARAALTVARILGIRRSEAERALRTFRGVGRRFEDKGTWRGIRFFDDYAHHPTEIRATLRAARERFGKRTKIWCVFQPHLYSHTRLLMKNFAVSFFDADEVLLADIYAAREKDDGKTSSQMLAVCMATHTSARYCGSFDVIASHLRTHAKRGDVVVTMGAGEAYKVRDLIVGMRSVRRW